MTRDTYEHMNGVREAADPENVRSPTLPPIRSVGRALAILQVVNRTPGLSIVEIADATKLPYATIYRMIMSLVHEGYVETELTRRRYHPTELVRTLASGFQEDDAIAAVARPVLKKLTAKLFWPMALMIRVGSCMLVKESTHSLTTQTFDKYYPGTSFPIFGTASGKAYLAFCPDQERRLIIAAGRQLNTSRDLETAIFLADPVERDHMLSDIRKKGYATQTRIMHDRTPGRTSSISVPILIDGVACSVLTLVYFHAAMSADEAVNAYLQPLLDAAAAMSEPLSKGKGEAGADR